MGLRVEDVRKEDGICYLDIVGHSGRRVKNLGSNRRVPVASALVILRLVYVQERRAQRKARCSTPRHRRSVHWIGEHLRRIGIVDRRLVFHSLRGTFKTACRDAGVPQEVHDALTGHANGSVGEATARCRCA